MSDAPVATATVRLERLTSQQLAGPGGDSAEDVVGRILAVQAQDDRGCRLAIRSRTRGLSVQDVDDALNDRRLVVTWLNRGTLHLVRTEDYWWLHPLTAPRTASALSHRLRQLGVSDGQARRAVDVIVETLKAEGPLARRDLKDRLDLPRSLTDGQTLVYLLGTASHRGLIVRGPMRGSDHAFVSVEAWLGHPPPAAEHTDGLGRLARRYLQGHGPAGPADLAKWAGITLGHARLGFSVLADRIRPRGENAVLRRRAARLPELPPGRLLGPFDPILHGWASREMWVGSHRSVVTTNGIFRATVLSSGRIAGTWRFSPEGIRVQLLEGVDEETSRDLVRDGLDVLRFMKMSPRRQAVSIEPAAG